MKGVEHGNANEIGKAHKNWIVGHFVCEESLRHTSAVEVKWGMTHGKNSEEDRFSKNLSARSISILIKGEYRFVFKNKSETEEVFLKEPGDYVIWLPKIFHKADATSEGAQVITIRWPSVPNDKVKEP